MKLTLFGQTDAGRVRSNNEDAIALDPGTNLAVLADGMGGYNAGEVASGMACAFIKSELVRYLDAAQPALSAEQIERAIQRCVQQANQSILQAAIANPEYAGMGCTVVVAVASANTLLLAHVGDSRCYRLRAGQLERLTKDHSMVQEKVDAGLLTPAQAARAPGKNLLTRALGVDATLQVEIHQHPMQAGDRYLLCSDGLTDMLSEAELTHLLGEQRPFAQTAQSLINLANAHGGRDNIAVVLLQVLTPTLGSGFLAKWFARK